MKMSRSNFIAFSALIGVIVWLSLTKSCGNVNTQDNGYDSLMTEIRDLKQSVSDRDTLLIVRDSVVYHTERLRETLREYRLTHDTLTKLILCDSIVVACDSMAYQYNRQDSIHRVQEHELKKIVSKQDTVIQFQASNINDLKRKNRVLKIVGGLIGAVLVSLAIR